MDQKEKQYILKLIHEELNNSETMNKYPEIRKITIEIFCLAIFGPLMGTVIAKALTENYKEGDGGGTKGHYDETGS